MNRFLATTAREIFESTRMTPAAQLVRELRDKARQARAREQETWDAMRREHERLSAETKRYPPHAKSASPRAPEAGRTGVPTFHQPVTAPPSVHARQATPPRARKIDVEAVYRDFNNPQIRQALDEVREVEARHGVNVIARIGEEAVRQDHARARAPQTMGALAAEYYGSNSTDVSEVIATSLRGGR